MYCYLNRFTGESADIKGVRNRERNLAGLPEIQSAHLREDYNPVDPVTYCIGEDAQDWGATLSNLRSTRQLLIATLVCVRQGRGITLFASDSGRQSERYSCKGGAARNECAITDTLRGTQENARRKRIRSQGEWFLQIENRESSVSLVRFRSRRRPDLRAASCDDCSANSSATWGRNHDSGQRFQLGGQVHC
jgi:hypothetical protein